MELGIHRTGPHGGNRVRRLLKAGHPIIGTDLDRTSLEDLDRRLRSREDHPLADRLLALLREAFGWHRPKGG